MDSKKGFTIVELLAVIVILGILAIILIPIINNNSNKTKEKMLETKEDGYKQSLILWAEDNRNCFTKSADDDCLIGRNKGCSLDNNILTCEVSYEQMADFGIIKYDETKNNNKRIINPVNTSNEFDLNNKTLTLYYNLLTKVFSYKEQTNEATTTKIAPSVLPQIIFSEEQSESWERSKTVEVTIRGGSSTLSGGGTIEYGWSASKDVAPSYQPVNINYNDGVGQIKFNVSNNTLSGKYYLWVKTNIKNKQNVSVGNKISNGTYWLDNNEPSIPTMSLSYGDFTAYPNNTYTNRNIYVGRSGGTSCTDPNVGPINSVDNESGVAKYQISTDKNTWYDYSYDCNNNIYKLSNEGTNARYIRACDKVGICGTGSNILELTAKIDKTYPELTLSNTSNNASYSGAWTNKDITTNLTFSDRGGSNINASSLSKGDSISSLTSLNNTNATAYTDTWSTDHKGSIYYQICDYAGNCTPKETTINLDKTAPKINSVEYVGNSPSGTLYNYGCTTNNVTSLITWSDEGEIQSGVNTSTLQWKATEGGTWSNSGFNNKTEVSATTTWTSIRSVNAYYRIFDNAGNESNVRRFWYKKEESCSSEAEQKYCYSRTTEGTCNSSYHGYWYQTADEMNSTIGTCRYEC